MSTLNGLGVLVTRPAPQAAPLCRRLETCGATVFELPALHIRPIDDRSGLLARLSPIESFDWVIFTSANAVRFGAWLLDHRYQPVVAAIGPATARALALAGIPEVLAPTHGFDSESLLREIALREASDRRVLIVTGARGRDVLRDQLTARGARVAVAEVYERVKISHPPEEFALLEARLAAGVIQIITATSVDLVAAMLESASPALRLAFERVHWVVPSERVAAALRERGLMAPLLRATSAEDQDLVTAIERWRSIESDA